MEVTNLQYANDTLFFCDEDDENIMAWWAILNLFLLGSGLALNKAKTTLICINLNDLEV